MPKPPKLIRSKIALQYIERDKTSIQKLKNNKDKRKYLAEKIIEEAKEVAAEIAAPRIKRKNLIEELADLQEIIYTAKILLHITDEEIKEAQDNKYEEKGGFEEFFLRLDKA